MDDSSPDLSLKLRRGSSDSRESFYMDFAQGIDSDIEEVTTIERVIPEHPGGRQEGDADTLATPSGLEENKELGQWALMTTYACLIPGLLFRKPSHPKVVVTYPKNEDPFDTRDRVKRKERPNDEWRFYMALKKYESEDYGDAEDWILKRNGHGPSEEKSEIRDTQPEPALRKLRSASQLPWSDPKSDKPQLTVEPYKNPRKPLPRISIKRPLSQRPDKNLDNKHLKLNAKAKPGIDTDHAIIASGFSKQERSIIITDNQLIQNDQTKTSFVSNAKINTGQSTQPGVIENNQPVDMSAQSSSKKLLTEQQPSPTFPAEQQLSPVGLDCQQSLSVPVIHLDESNKDIETCQNVLPEPVAEERLSTKTPPNTMEQTIQAEPINERSTLLVRHEHSLPELHPRDISVRQSKEPDDSQKTYHKQILTASKIVPMPPSTDNQAIQQYVHPQLPILPVSSISYSKPKPQQINQSNSIEVVHNHQKLRSQGSIQSTLSTSHREPNWKKPSQLCTSSVKKQIPVAKNLKNPVDKKTRLEGITKNIIPMQYPPNSTMQLSAPTGMAVMQTEPLAQNHLQHARNNVARVTSLLVNNIGGSMAEECMGQRDLLSEGIMNTSAAQNLSKLAHQYSSFVEAPREQQYLSTQEDYLRMHDMFRTPNMARTIDPRVHHQNAVMNGGFTIQSQPNPFNQPIQFLPRNYNQYTPVNSAYAQGVIRRELTRRSIDEAHTTYKPIVQNGVNIELTVHNPSNQSHQNYEDPCTANTQNSLRHKSKRRSHIIGPEKVTKRPRSLSASKTPGEALSDAHKSYLIQEIDLQSRMNQSFTEYNNINLADIREKFTIEPLLTTQDSNVQTMLSSDRHHETQSTLAQSNYVYRQPRTKKTMVDQATETDSIIDVDHCVDEIVRSPVGEITPKVVDSVCQTDEWLREEQGPPYQETASDSASETEPEIELENGVMSEANQTTLPILQNLTPDNQQKQSRIDVEQDMLSTFGTLLTQMGASLSLTRDMFNNLRNSTLVCAQTYEKLLEQVDKFNSIETPPR